MENALKNARKARDYQVKRSVSVLLVLLLLCNMILLTACGDSPTSTTPSDTSSTTTTPTSGDPPPTESTSSTQPHTHLDPNAMQTYELTANSPVKVTGRQTALEKGITLDHSASSVEFNVNLTAPSDVNATMLVGDGVFFVVYIDGVRQAKRIQFTAVRGTTQTLAQQLPAGAHNIRLVRETENAKGIFTLASVSFKGTFGDKPQDNPYYIEFIGDSITCGTGNLHKYLENATNPYEFLQNQTGTCTGAQGDNNPTDEQSATLTYAYLAAQALGADTSFVCRTGIGLYGGWGTTMPDYYMYTSYERSHTGTSSAYIASRKADLVVINLGTNDEYTLTSADHEAFKNEVVWMITLIRWMHGNDVKILWTSGMMNEAKKTFVQKAIDGLNDDNIYTFFGYSKTSGGHNGHPTYPAHEEAAQQLEAYIRENILN